MIVSSVKRKITGPTIAVDVVRALIAALPDFERDKEHFWAIGMNVRAVIQYVDLVSTGTLNNSLVHPREVFRMAIHRGVCSLIVAHNHPSGECCPSFEDNSVTKRLAKAGEVLGIPIRDHLIVSESESYSFAESSPYSLET